jgi:hypothetical protein
MYIHVREQVDTVAVVRKFGNAIVAGRRADGNGTGGPSGRPLASTAGLIARGHDDRHSVLYGQLHGVNESITLDATETNVEEQSAIGTAGRGDLSSNDVLDAQNRGRQWTRPRGIDHLDNVQGGVARHPHSLAGNNG